MKPKLRLRRTCGCFDPIHIPGLIWLFSRSRSRWRGQVYNPSLRSMIQSKNSLIRPFSKCFWWFHVGGIYCLLDNGFLCCLEEALKYAMWFQHKSQLKIRYKITNHMYPERCWWIFFLPLKRLHFCTSFGDYKIYERRTKQFYQSKPQKYYPLNISSLEAQFIKEIFIINRKWF